MKHTVYLLLSVIIMLLTATGYWYVRCLNAEARLQRLETVYVRLQAEQAPSLEQRCAELQEQVRRYQEIIKQVATHVLQREQAERQAAEQEPREPSPDVIRL